MSFPNYSRRNNMVRPSKQTNKATKIFMETIRQAQSHIFVKGAYKSHSSKLEGSWKIFHPKGTMVVMRGNIFLSLELSVLD